MKYYYYDPNSYDMEYHVLANSREEADEFVFSRYGMESWKRANPNFEVKEFSVGEVNVTEIS